MKESVKSNINFEKIIEEIKKKVYYKVENPDGTVKYISFEDILTRSGITNEKNKKKLMDGFKEGYFKGYDYFAKHKGK